MTRRRQHPAHGRWRACRPQPSLPGTHVRYTAIRRPSEAEAARRDPPPLAVLSSGCASVMVELGDRRCRMNSCVRSGSPAARLVVAAATLKRSKRVARELGGLAEELGVRAPCRPSRWNEVKGDDGAPCSAVFAAAQRRPLSPTSPDPHKGAPTHRMALSIEVLPPNCTGGALCPVADHSFPLLTAPKVRRCATLERGCSRQTDKIQPRFATQNQWRAGKQERKHGRMSHGESRNKTGRGRKREPAPKEAPVPTEAPTGAARRRLVFKPLEQRGRPEKEVVQQQGT